MTFKVLIIFAKLLTTEPKLLRMLYQLCANLFTSSFIYTVLWCFRVVRIERVHFSRCRLVNVDVCLTRVLPLTRSYLIFRSLETPLFTIPNGLRNQKLCVFQINKILEYYMYIRKVLQNS